MLGNLRKGLLQLLQPIHSPRDAPIGRFLGTADLEQGHRALPAPAAPGSEALLEQVEQPISTSMLQIVEAPGSNDGGRYRQSEHVEQLEQALLNGPKADTAMVLTWDGEAQMRGEWLLSLRIDDLPSSPFRLDAHRLVTDPERFLARLKNDYLLGPRGPRAWRGALQKDLALVEQLLGKEA